MTANCKLNNLEYLALKILGNPGQSGRFYLKALHKYRFPLVKNAKGNFCPEYFSPGGKYFGVLWEDVAECTVPFQSNIARRNRPLRVLRPQLPWQFLKPASSEWHLTDKGIVMAEKAAEKIGLSMDLRYDQLM
jgi:hypothetical protein